MILEERTDILTRVDFEKSFGTDEFSIQDKLRKGIILLVDKPEGWTSFDVVNKIKKTFGIKKVGHAGTLDPMATGLLVICTAAKTREVECFVGLDKTYTGILKLGEITPSYDAETEVIERKAVDHISEEMVYETANRFVGTTTQLPPMYSAIKKDGKPLYKLARKGIETERKSRTISIYEFMVTRIEIPFVSFKIRCSKGTYIRSIAHDFGEKLNTGAHLTQLRRVAVGSLRVDHAITIENLNELKDRLKRNYV